MSYTHMNLFLASKIDQTIDLLIREYNMNPANVPTVFIPTAQNCFTPPPSVEERGSYQCLIQRGFPIRIIDIEKEQEASLLHKLSPVKLIVVGGGNTYYLLYHMKRSGLHRVLASLIPKGLIYAGSSAGSCVCSPDVTYIRHHDDPTAAPALTDFQGMGFVDFEIYPHCIESQYEADYTGEFLTATLKSKTKKVFLRDHQAMVVKNDWCKLVSV